MSGEPAVAVVSVNWNGLEDTRACIESVLKSSYSAIEHFIVDNGSGRQEADALEREFGSAIHLIRSPRNTGFSGGNNLAIGPILQAARHEYVVTLNNDTTVDPEWMTHLVEAAKADRRVGMVAAKMRFADRRDTINSTGILILRDGAAIDRGRREVDRGQYDQLTDIFGPSAGAALYRADMLREVGNFDDDFFAYFEDVDLAWRARLMGWQARFSPSSVVYHKYSASSGAFSAFKVYQGERNRIWLALKNLPPRHLVGVTPFNVSKNFRTFTASRRGEGRGVLYQDSIGMPSILRSFAKARIDACRGVAPVLRKRKWIQSSRRASDQEVERWFRDYGLPLSVAAYR